MRKGLWVSVLLLAVVLILPTACKAPAEPAKFEVMSLDVTPTEVTAAGEVSVTAQVKNTGGSEGVYTAVLTVDGAKVETTEVAVAPGATQTVTFTVMKDKAGTYQIAVGELSSSLTVKPKLVAKEMELKYDDGVAEGRMSSAGGGYLVDFMPPDAPLTIKKVRIYGARFGGWQGDDFKTEIWGRDYKLLYSAKYPATKFPAQAATSWEIVKGLQWVDVEIPDIEVSDKFYIHVFTGTGRDYGIHVGVDNSVVNEHSNISVRTTKGDVMRADWPYVGGWGADKSKVNWMIRVVGTVMAPKE